MTPAEWQIVAFTAGMAVLSTALILVPGVMLAWCLARLRWRGKSLVETVVALPLVLPPVVTGLVLLKLFGRRGPPRPLALLGIPSRHRVHLARRGPGAGSDVISVARAHGAFRD